MCNNACQYKVLFTLPAVPCHHSLYWFVATLLVPRCPSNGYSIKQHLVDNVVYVIQFEIKSVLYCSYWTWMSSGHFVAVISGVNEAWGILLLASKSLCSDAFRTFKKLQHVWKCVYDLLWPWLIIICSRWVIDICIDVQSPNTTDLFQLSLRAYWLRAHTHTHTQ